MNEQHTITTSEGEYIEIGDLTIRSTVRLHAIGDEDRMNIQVYGWRNNDPNVDDSEVFVGDYEVEVADFELPLDPDYESGETDQVTFTLTQRQIDDALALYDEFYIENQS